MAGKERPFNPEEAKAKLQELGATIFYEKVLTNSDASGTGRIVIPKSVAETNFPELEQQLGVILPFIDVWGKRHQVRFRFWINNASRMYLLEGTQPMLHALNLSIGNVLTFAKNGEGHFVVSGRTGTKDDVARKSSGNKKGNSLKVKRAHSASQQPRVADGRFKRTKPLDPVALEAQRHQQYWGGLSIPITVDGVFRAMPNNMIGQPHATAGCRTESQHGCWTAIVDLGGELFQAYFNSEEAAQAAFSAALQEALPEDGVATAS